jgi:hypothetical protein
MCARVEQAPPLRDRGLDALPPRSIGLLSEPGQEQAQRLARVALQRDVDRIAHAELALREIDLHRLGLPFLRQPLRVREAGADHEQRVAVHHDQIARLGAQQADRSGHVGKLVGQDGLAEQRLRNAGAQPLRARGDLGRRAERARADQDRDLGGVVEDRRGVVEIGVVRHDARCAVAHRRVDRAVLARRAGDRALLLDVVGEDHAGHGAARARDAERAIDQRARLRRVHARLAELARDVAEQPLQIDLLLVVGAERHALLLADDRDHGLVVLGGVVEAVEQVDRARPRGRHADADLAGELRVRARHERGELLVADLDEAELVRCAVERTEEAVDAVAGIPVDRAHAPAVQPLHDEVADGGAHDGLPSRPRVAAIAIP